MNTTTAAIQAGVTTATIRTWCRRNVIAAAKQAGRWVIDTASLAHRIAIGAMRARKQAAPMIDLSATYTAALAGYDGPVTITPTVKKGANGIKITGLAPLFADRFDAIPDLGDRLHALTVFQSALIFITDQYDADWDGDPQGREGGQLRTTYRGGVAGITIDDVLDLAAQLRTQLA